MAKTIEQLKAQSAEVKNASVIGENTATRVGSLFNDIVEHVEAYEAGQAQKDTEQSTSINAETTRATAAETTLSERINQEVTDRKAMDETIGVQLSSEIERAKGMELGISTKLNDEIERAQEAENDLHEQITSEAEARDLAINSEAQARTQNDQLLSQAIAAEQERAEAAEQANAQGIIYDVSARNNGAVFESLSALLSNSDLSTLIPTSVRYGGMTIRFIQGSEQSSDNKYVQFRLMNQNWSANESDWQGVDDVPTAGSNNLVKSDGVYYGLSELKFSVDNNIPFTQGYYLNKNGNLNADDKGYYTDFIRVRQGDSFLYNGEERYGNPAIYVMYSADKTVISYENTEKVYVDETITVNNSNVKYIRFGSYITSPSCKKILSVPSNTELKEEIDAEKNKTNNIFLNSFNIGKDIANDLCIAVLKSFIAATYIFPL